MPNTNKQMSNQTQITAKDITHASMERTMAHLYTVKASPGKGIGVFSNGPITPGTPILQDKTVMKLQRPAQDVTETQITSAFDALTASEQTHFLSLHENGLPYASRAMRIYKSNCFGDESDCWLYLHISRLNHSCAPNAEIAEVDNEEAVKVVALKRIAADEEVLISYLGPLEEGMRDKRRWFLQSTYGFECRCAVCCLQGSEKWMSDARRELIAFLSCRQLGFEPDQLRYLGDVNGLATPKATTLGRSKQPLEVPLTAAEKVANNFLLAKLLEAEGQINYRLAQAYVTTAVRLMGQMQELRPLIIIPAAGYVMEWLDAAVSTMREIRNSDSFDVKELEQACYVLQSNSYMNLAKTVMREKGKKKGKAKGQEKGDAFATVFGQPEMILSQAEAIKEAREMRRGGYGGGTAHVVC